jgi:translation initiation factor IF-3
MAPEVRVIGPEGEQLGVMSMQDAMRRAADFDVDVVETVATANPPVVRLIDYGKFKYQEQKREAEAKAKQTVIEVKEIKLRPGTDEGDYQVKMRNIKRFLEDGDKVKVTLRFRGREITHQEIGMAQLERIKTELGDLIVVESMPRLEGKQMVMMIAPGKKKGNASKPAVAATSSNVTDSESSAAAPVA